MSCQGIYGARTAIAQQYNISRTFLYQMMAVATLYLHQLFSEYKDVDLPPNRLNLDSVIVLLRMAGHVSISAISEMLQIQGYPHDFVGLISQ